MSGARWSSLILLFVLGGCTITNDPEAAPGGSPDAAAVSTVIGNGRAVAAASSNGTASVVATTIGADYLDDTGMTHSITTTLDPPLRVSMSPDGRAAALVSGTAGAEIWSLGDAPELVTELDPVVGVAFTADSAALIVTYPTEVWSYPTGPGSASLLLSAPAGAQFGPATFKPDGSVIYAPVVAGDGTDMLIYDATVGATTAEVLSQPGWTISTAAATNDRVVLEAIPGDPFEKVLLSWNAAEQTIEWQTDIGSISSESVWALGVDGRVLIADSAGLRLLGVDGSPAADIPLDGSRRIVASVPTATGYTVAMSDGSLLFLDLDGSVVGDPPSSGAPLTDVGPFTGGPGTVSVDTLGKVSYWDPAGTNVHESSQFVASDVNDVALLRDGTSVAYGTRRGVAGVTKIADPSSLIELAHPEGNVDAVAFSADGSTLLTGVGERLSDVSFDDTVSLWNLSDDERRFEFGGEGEDVNGCADFKNVVEYSPDGTTFAASSHDFTVSIHDAATGALINTFPPERSTVLDFAYSPDGTKLVTTSDDGVVRIWSLADFSPITDYVAPPGGYFSIAFMPDGTSLVTSDITGTIRTIDVMTGVEERLFEGAKSRTSDLAVSPDGSSVAAGTDRYTIGIWSTTSGEMVNELSGHHAPVTSVAFSADGSTLASGSQDATVRLWQVV